MQLKNHSLHPLTKTCNKTSLPSQIQFLRRMKTKEAPRIRQPKSNIHKSHTWRQNKSQINQISSKQTKTNDQ